MMNKPPKLGRKSSEEILIKKPISASKKPNPRNPLKNIINVGGGGSLPLTRTSTDAQKGGCFRFLLSNSSSRDPFSISSRCLPKTPKSAPPMKNPIPSKARPRCKENLKKLEPNKGMKPETPDLVQRWSSRKKPITEVAYKGKNPSSEVGFDVGLDRNSGKVCVLQHGQFMSSTPEKTSLKEGEQKLSKTPSSAATPPIEASISPEIMNVSSVAPTPVCFAAGHVMVGVQDRRKCRPRGILTIAGPIAEPTEASPPLVEASMHWLSSPSGDLNAGTDSGSRSRSSVRMTQFCNEDSVNWLLSPQDKQDGSVLGDKSPSDIGLWRVSPNSDTSVMMGLHSPVLETETPSSGLGIRGTPTSGSSTSPFSAILQRAAASSGLMDLRVKERRGGYRYSSIVEDSPLSTPSSYYGSTKKDNLPPFELDSAAEVLRTMSLSPKPPTTSDESFHFGCPVRSSNYIDRTKQGVLAPETRISWREGLVSRMFEMGELDRFPWMFDEGEEEERAESLFGFKFASNSWSSTVKEGEDQLAHGFGSFEYQCGDVLAQKGEGKISPPVPIACAESISTEGGDQLISSGDSDWTLLYRNHLFEV